MHCRYCDTEIVQLGNRMREYCNNKCRMAYKRRRAKLQAVLTEQNLNPNTVQSEQIQSEQPKRTDSNSDRASRTVLKSETISRVFDRLATRAVSLADYQSHPEDYATRTNPELINWGPWLNMAQLEAHKRMYKLSKYHNRSPIPGDWDYVGVAV